MGASESNPAVKGVAPFNPTVEVVEKSKYDPHFGQIKIVRDTKTSDLYILKEIVVNTKEEFERVCQSIRNRVALKYPNVVNILGYTTEEKSNFCSTHYKISIYIEILEKTLESELEQRQKAKVHYSEHDLLFVAESLISGLAQFQDQKVAHEDIRPFNIFVENRAYKLTDPFLSADQNANALVLAITQSIKTNLAPELIPQVPKRAFEITADRNRADVYSLGITLLSLGTLKNSEEWYDYEKGVINQSLVEASLESLRPRYSRFTYELIRDMLIVDPVQRPVFSNLANTLAPYRVEIREGGALPFLSTVSPQFERVTRSALPQDNTYTPDDLELRIQAALERSAQTFKTVAGRDSYNPPRDTGYVEQTYVAPTTTTTTYNYSYATPSTTDKVVEIRTVKETETRSAVPQDYKETSYTPAYSFGTVEPEKKAYETSYTSYNVSTTPVTDNYGGLSNSRVAATGGLSNSRVAGDYTANAGTTSYTTYNVSTTPITENYGGLSNSRVAGDSTANAGTTSYTTYNVSTTPITDNYGGLSNSRVAATEGLSNSRVAGDSTANAGTTSYTTYNVTSYEYQPKTEIKTELPVSSYSYQVESTSTGLAGTGLAEPVYKYESSTLPVTSGTTGENTYSYSYQTSSYGTGQAGTGVEGTSYSYTTPYAGTTTTTTYQYVSSTAQPAELNEISGLGNLGGDKVSVSYNAIAGEQNQA